MQDIPTGSEDYPQYIARLTLGGKGSVNQWCGDVSGAVQTRPTSSWGGCEEQGVSRPAQVAATATVVVLDPPWPTALPCGRTLPLRVTIR